MCSRLYGAGVRKPSIDLTTSIRRQERDRYGADRAGYRRRHKGRGGTGPSEVEAWWPQILAALQARITQRRIWERLRTLGPAELGDLPALTIDYATFNKHVRRKLREVQSVDCASRPQKQQSTPERTPRSPARGQPYVSPDPLAPPDPDRFP